MTALGISLFVQLDVWRAVRSNGNDDEHDDFKIRMEQRMLKEMERAVEEKKAVTAKLIEAHNVLRKEKADVRAMHDHAPSQSGEQAGKVHAKTATFVNPLQEQD